MTDRGFSTLFSTRATAASYGVSYFWLLGLAPYCGGVKRLSMGILKGYYSLEFRVAFLAEHKNT